MYVMAAVTSAKHHRATIETYLLHYTCIVLSLNIGLNLQINKELVLVYNFFIFTISYTMYSKISVHILV